VTRISGLITRDLARKKDKVKDNRKIIRIKEKLKNLQTHFVKLKAAGF
jgi:hypothetical protein